MAQPWEPFVAAAFAPAVVWLLWRGQTLSVEALRWRMLKLVHARRTAWLYSIVSWFGVLLHEVSHAVVLLLSGHGIRQFRAGVEQGHVLPSRTREGAVGFLSFLLAALAPLFIPPLLVLVALAGVVGLAVVRIADAVPGLPGAIEVLRAELVTFPADLALAVAGLDLAQWPQALVLLLILLAMPSSRPSHVKGSAFHGTKDEGDVAVLRARIRRNPLIFLAFVLVLYATYFVTTAWAPAAPVYWTAFQVLWAIALTGILLSLFGAAWWSLVALGTRTWAAVWWLGPLAFAAAQVLLRAVPATGHLAPMQVNGIAVAAWLAVAGALAILLPRRR